MGKRLLIISSFVILVFFQTAFAETTKQVFSSSRNSVVLVLSYDRNNMPLALGSGFFISPKKIVTNYHLIEGAGRILVKSTALGMQTEVSGIDAYSRQLDLAVLRVDAEGPALRIKEKQDQEVGDRVIAIGNPRGLESTLSEGIISGLRKADDFFIYQVTASVSPGSSGGPLLDDRGYVIGVTTATITDGQNLNFAVPILLLKRLQPGGKWEPGQTGITGEIRCGNAGISLSDFTKRSQYSTEFTFSLQNETKNTIKNLAYLILFKNVETRKMIHFAVYFDSDTIPPGLAIRKQKRERALEGVSTDRQYLQPHLRSYADCVISAELRVLSYEIVDREATDTILDVLEKKR